ncbi:bifunctional diguanylate cyclase/phosphodiesterase [Bosea sp. (in: a-proteobacteria)]|uniref:putative bifunctional diguanylate cyclase/phosphodiesterase n=1 Tax=Bosea sp. (in: a-proteobacteria) TaxID=1871050 RepID=UPI0027374CCD|nr:EAL domain-containing protein [Bosea sp. (in: a-proteobacteria)]MDP3410895.1 EAL domain-containing protein [Bosea sp. (in: a-proteobacteria)]
MSSPAVAKLTNADASARMLKSTVATLGCAFVMVMAAAVAVVLAIAGDANRLEAERQRDRIEAAIESQVRLRELRFQSLAAAGELQNSLAGPDPLLTLQTALAQLGGRFLEFDGAYIVSSSGVVFAGIEGNSPAGQAGYDALKHFSPTLPGARNAGGAPMVRLPDLRGGPGTAAWSLTHDGFETVSVMTIDIAPRRGSLLSQLLGPIKVVGYRRVTDSILSELAQRYRIADIRIVRTAPSDPLSSRAIPSADGTVRAWLSWAPDRPGDAMLRQFAWALAGVGLLFAAIFAFVVHRLRGAADQIAVREGQIQRLAGQDELSLLPNRRTFDLRLDQELAHLGRTGAGLAVLLIDLDRFKAVNDTYGHTAGDELIRQVAQRLSRLVRSGDTVARIGGDEFGIIQTYGNFPAGCAALGERILASLTEPFVIMGVATTIGCSIGIALAPDDATDRETLLRLADTALYQSKHGGRNRYSFFEAQMNRTLALKRMVEEDLRRAIENDELLLHYQPQVSVDGATIVGVEALVRWNHPEHGMVPPAEFIGIAEERGLIVPLSEWVLRQACKEAKRWEGIRLAVNVSPIQFRHKDFVANVIRIIDETGFDPTRLELELTEGVVVDDADAAEAAMMDLRAHGVGLALDDFGTGYSSLIYLRRFAFDKIKIDRSFLEYMETTGESAILVHSIAHLGRALGLRVCAEGVETAEQHRFMQAIGCHELQGFLFSKGVPADEIDRLLTQDKPFAGILAAA